MNWITLTEADVLTVLSGAELTMLRGTALAEGQPDPLEPVIATVTLLVRAYVSQANALAAEGIPAVLKGPALDLVAVRLGNRVGKDPTHARQDAHDAAIKLLEAVARGEVSVDNERGLSGSARTTRRSEWGRDHEDGI